MAYKTIYDTVAVASNGNRFVICSGPSKGKRATTNNMIKYGNDVVDFFDENGGFDMWEWSTNRKVFVFTNEHGEEVGLVKQEANSEKSRKEKARVIALENDCVLVSTCR